MASINYESKKNGWRLQFRDLEKRKRSIWLGGVRESEAQDTKEHVEHLLERVGKGRPPELATAEWLDGQGKKYRNKLSKCGLVESTTQRVARDLTLSAWMDEYFAERTDAKTSTHGTYKRAKSKLLTHFGKQKRLRNITVADAKKWRVWVKTKSNERNKNTKACSEETTRRMTGIAKLLFNEAMERGLVESNPFKGLASTAMGNEKRKHFVKAEVIEACMDHCPCGDWKLILALCRFGGLRCPSELVALRWSDVDLPGGRMTINATKTEHHAAGGVRVCPIFPELRPYLERAWDNAPDDGTAEWVINRYRRPDQNLHETFKKILTRAGIQPWPRLFQNLRASRETELMARYPAKDVASWLGNSEPTAMKHYAMATDEAFQAASNPDGQTVTRPATKNTAASGSSCGSISGISGAIGDSGQVIANADSHGKTRGFIVQDSAGDYYLVGLAGLEPAT
ncbi:MAG: tyrosine-type recombinase/integrase [Pirellulaceae bacterium]